MIGQLFLLLRRGFAPITAGRQCSHPLKIHKWKNFGFHQFQHALLVTALDFLVRFGDVEDFLADPFYQRIRGLLLRIGESCKCQDTESKSNNK